MINHILLTRLYFYAGVPQEDEALTDKLLTALANLSKEDLEEFVKTYPQSIKEFFAESLDYTAGFLGGKEERRLMEILLSAADSETLNYLLKDKEIRDQIFKLAAMSKREVPRTPEYKNAEKWTLADNILANARQEWILPALKTKGSLRFIEHAILYSQLPLLIGQKVNDTHITDDEKNHFKKIKNQLENPVSSIKNNHKAFVEMLNKYISSNINNLSFTDKWLDILKDSLAAIKSLQKSESKSTSMDSDLELSENQLLGLIARVNLAIGKNIQSKLAEEELALIININLENAEAKKSQIYKPEEESNNENAKRKTQQDAVHDKWKKNKIVKDKEAEKFTESAIASFAKITNLKNISQDDKARLTELIMDSNNTENKINLLYRLLQSVKDNPDDKPLLTTALKSVLHFDQSEFEKKASLTDEENQNIRQDLFFKSSTTRFGVDEMQADAIKLKELLFFASSVKSAVDKLRSSVEAKATSKSGLFGNSKSKVIIDPLIMKTQLEILYFELMNVCKEHNEPAKLQYLQTVLLDKNANPQNLAQAIKGFNQLTQDRTEKEKPYAKKCLQIIKKEEPTIEHALNYSAQSGVGLKKSSYS